jgi:hypothetical protein
MCHWIFAKQGTHARQWGGTIALWRAALPLAASAFISTQPPSLELRGLSAPRAELRRQPCHVIVVIAPQPPAHLPYLYSTDDVTRTSHEGERRPDCTRQVRGGSGVAAPAGCGPGVECAVSCVGRVGRSTVHVILNAERDTRLDSRRARAHAA